MTWRLECGACGRDVPKPLATVCPDCEKPLLARYDLASLDGATLKEAWSARPDGMWKYRELMPLEPEEAPVTRAVRSSAAALLTAPARWAWMRNPAR